MDSQFELFGILRNDTVMRNVNPTSFSNFYQQIELPLETTRKSFWQHWYQVQPQVNFIKHYKKVHGIT